MDNLPIDIHSNKLLDWLISRRHCNKNWQDSIAAIRRKIGSAIEDMPENEAILQLLQATYITYFHCKEIVEILKETEKDSKNIFGFYSSQRMKDWQEIAAMYEKGNIYLAEAAQFLQRFIQYEIPSLRKQISRMEHDIEDAARKESDYERLAVDSLRQYDRELAEWKVKGENLNAELLELASRGLPSFVGSTFLRVKKLSDAVVYYTRFAEYTDELAPLTLESGQQRTPLPMLRLMMGAASAPLVFEWVHGKPPDRVERPALAMETKAAGVGDEDEIDFGDDAADQIDYGISVEKDEEDLSGGNLEANAADGDAIARGEEAYSVLENTRTLATVVAELEELRAFLAFRKVDELDENPSDVYLSGVCEIPKELVVKRATLDSWLALVAELLPSLKDPTIKYLVRVQSSPVYVDQLANQLSEKQRSHVKYQKFKAMAAEKQEKLVEGIRTSQKKLTSIVEAAKYLQEKLEAAISKRYNNREVYIMGEINAVLFNQ